MPKSLRRIAILTAGGDCPGLNAVIRAVARAAWTVHGWEVHGVRNGAEGFLVAGGRGIRRLWPADVAGILPRGGTILGASNRCDLFAAVDSKGVTRDRSGDAIALMRRKGIDALVVVGGDGSQRMAERLSRLGLPVVGVPKTIDNDVLGTDRTFGFDTAVEIVTEAIDRLYTTAESHHRVMLVEVMGRHSGFIALHAGLAGGAEVILLPEIPYDTLRIARKVKARAQRGRNYSIVVVAEGARPPGGELVFREGDGSDVQRSRLGGVSAHVAEALRVHTHLEVRNIVLGHVQRGGTPTALDRMLASWMGQHAVTLLAEGRFGTMVALKGTELTHVPLAQVVKGVRQVNVEGPLVRAAREIGVSFAAADGGDDAYSESATSRRRK